MIVYMCIVLSCFTVDQADPYGFISGQHLNRVLARYGAPLIILAGLLIAWRERQLAVERQKTETVQT